MPTVAIFLSEGDLGDCAQHALKLALADPAVHVRAIARDAAVVGVAAGRPLLDLDDLRHPRLTTHVIPYDSAAAFATAQLTAVLDGADAVIAAPSSRQAFKERKAAPSMRALCAAMASRHVSAKRLVYVSTVGVDAPPLPWSAAAGKQLARALAAGRAVVPDFRAADACVRGSGLAYTIVRPVGLAAAAPPRGAWEVLAAADRVGPLEAAIAPADVGRFLLEEALRPPRRGGGDVQIGWAPRGRAAAGAHGGRAAAAAHDPLAAAAAPARKLAPQAAALLHAGAPTPGAAHAGGDTRSCAPSMPATAGLFHSPRARVAEGAAALRSTLAHAGDRLHRPRRAAQTEPAREEVVLAPEGRRARPERVPVVIIK